MKKEDRPTPFVREVMEQPEALLRLADYYDSDEGKLKLSRWNEMLEAYRSLCFIGMGTSSIVPLICADRFHESHRGVEIHDAGEYLHYMMVNEVDRSAEGVLYVLVSQSGESVETRKVTELLSGSGAGTVVPANDSASTMAGLAGLHLPLLAGEELSVSNKTYANSIALFTLLAGGGTGAVRDVAAWLPDSADTGEVTAAAEFLQPADSVHFVARGPALVSAHQMALTFMEGARTHGCAFTGGAFRHGPFEVTGEQHRMVCLAPQGSTGELMLNMAAEAAGLGSRVLLITDFTSPPEESESLKVLRLRSFGDERLFPLCLVVLQGMLLHHVARLRGYEAGKFEKVSKVTTRE